MIICDHVLVREGLELVLRREYGDILFGEARTKKEALDQLNARPWRLVILDAGLPKDVLEGVCARRPQPTVLMLGTDADFADGARARQLGAAGWVAGNCSRAEVMKAVRNVLDGKKHFSESASPKVGNLRPATVQPDLSDQERKVLRAVAAGRPTTEIAAELELSCKTVSTYKHRGFHKLGIKSTADLVRYVDRTRTL